MPWAGVVCPTVTGSPSMSKQLTCSVIGLPVRSVWSLPSVVHAGVLFVTVTEAVAVSPFSTESLA